MYADSSQEVAWLATHSGCCGASHPFKPFLQPGGGQPHFVGSVHNDGANIAFWDGHVKWAKQASINAEDNTPGIFFDANRQN